MKNKEVNPGVRCHVDECIFNVKGDLCSASEIEVASTHSRKDMSQADCLTFETGGLDS